MEEVVEKFFADGWFELVDDVAGGVGEAAAEAEDGLEFILWKNVDNIGQRRAGLREGGSGIGGGEVRGLPGEWRSGSETLRVAGDADGD